MDNTLTMSFVCKVRGSGTGTSAPASILRDCTDPLSFVKKMMPVLKGVIKANDVIEVWGWIYGFKSSRSRERSFLGEVLIAEYPVSELKWLAAS